MSAALLACAVQDLEFRHGGAAGRVSRSAVPSGGGRDDEAAAEERACRGCGVRGGVWRFRCLCVAVCRWGNCAGKGRVGVATDCVGAPAGLSGGLAVYSSVTKSQERINLNPQKQKGWVSKASNASQQKVRSSLLHPVIHAIGLNRASQIMTGTDWGWGWG